jgi:hypothetical protein
MNAYCRAFSNVLTAIKMSKYYEMDENETETRRSPDAWPSCFLDRRILTLFGSLLRCDLARNKTAQHSEIQPDENIPHHKLRRD